MSTDLSRDAVLKRLLSVTEKYHLMMNGILNLKRKSVTYLNSLRFVGNSFWNSFENHDDI